jgi:hypothetical protein
MYKANLKTKPTYNQVLTGEAKHTFQWSRDSNMLLWELTLWGANPVSQGNYALHRANMLRIEGYEQDHIGNVP